MDNNNKNRPNPTSMRVLTRPPSTPPPSPKQPPPPPPPRPPPPPPPPLPSGVVVIGFIGRRHSDVSHLLNQILDSNVFGSSRNDTPLIGDSSEIIDEIKVWFKSHKISYYYDQVNCFLFLQFSQSFCPSMASVSGVDSVVEDLEFGELQGMLFMFTVCHIIVYIQEGSRFDTQIFKNLRVLQSSKHALIPFLKSHTILPSITRPSTSSSRPPTPSTSSKSPSPRRGSSISNRSNSISVMSNLGSYTALFPGQCTPVVLFAFLDDFSELNSSTVVEESNEPSSSQSNVSSLARSILPVKGSSSVIVLSRPTNNNEGGSRKKLQSSIEAQIRFLIKKCRTLSGSESSNIGPRSGSMSGSTPLLTLDASRAVVLLDRSSVSRGESLDFVTGLLEDVLSGKAKSDALLLESQSQSGNKDDIMTLKEFISRQADILRGKGGLTSNSNSGSAPGVGMVAVAAAAAAASAASGRAASVPELPSLETWLTSSQLILKGILLAKPSSVDEPDLIRRKFRQRTGAPPLVEATNSKGTDPTSMAVSLLESGKGINRKFSTLWCQRVLPSAMEVYLKDLPPCYSTSQHEAQLEKALNSFQSMVKGPSVLEFRKKLEEECTSIWKSGRQLCDAISLIGKPCMYQRHDVKNNDGLSSDSIEREHSSGFVFLHACACGRSRKIRSDPFDFESANVEFNIFSDCDKLLPVLQLPNVSETGPVKPSSWYVVRIGGSKYYDPSKGLLQAGFSHNQKFLLRWTIVLEKDKNSVISFANALRQGSSHGKPDLKLESTEVKDGVKSTGTLAHPGEVQRGIEGQKLLNGSLSDSRKISFGRGFPVTTMKKAFSEVVAGSTSSDAAFPPLPLKTQLPSLPGKVKKNSGRVSNGEQIRNSVINVQRSENFEENSLTKGQNLVGTKNVGLTDGNPFLHIGTTVVPLNVDDSKNTCEMNNTDNGDNTKFDPSIRHFTVYVGFEHECPRGHRFILSPELLNQLGHPYTLSEESHAHSVEHVNRKHRGPPKSGKNDGHIKAHRAPNGKIDSDTSVSGISLSKSEMMPSFGTDVQQSCNLLDVESNGPGFTLLNRNLPLYLNCPHCKAYKNKKDGQNLKFAGTISQLQRIFVVTPPFPVVLATNPIVEFEKSYQPEGVSNLEHNLQFNLGCQIILPPESFISIRLPFIYGFKDREKGLLSLNPFEHQPELTAWVKQGTVLQTIGKGSSPD